MLICFWILPIPALQFPFETLVLVEGAIDAKVLAMPHPKVCGLYNEIESYLDIPDWRLAPIYPSGAAPRSTVSASVSMKPGWIMGGVRRPFLARTIRRIAGLPGCG